MGAGQKRSVDRDQARRNVMTKREFLVASVGAGLGLAQARALAQQGSPGVPRTGGGPSAGNQHVPSRMAKTTKLFKSPGVPNGIAVAPEGLWVAEQKLS